MREKELFIHLCVITCCLDKESVCFMFKVHQQLLKPTPKILLFLILADVVQYMACGDDTDSYIFTSTKESP